MLDLLIYLDENNRGGFIFRVNTYMGKLVLPGFAGRSMLMKTLEKFAVMLGGWSISPSFI